jgi:predicted unusual protein kinase regulating ubiquinone biosynthesis (AarF/ABC1/UbiB family)
VNARARPGLIDGPRGHAAGPPANPRPRPQPGAIDGHRECGYSENVVSAPIDRSRYRRVRRFLIGVLLHALWWDVVLNRRGLRRFRTPALDRWRRIARRYSELAIELGGVLIKLGQFLSTRVDVLPREITEELAGLQDRVPPATSELIIAEIESSLGGSLDDHLLDLEPEAVGAASLAQVHCARLRSGERVVVKVLRPGIETLVETDLAAFAHALRWLRLSRTIRRRVDVAWIEREFAAVTRRELDLVAEGHSAERFAADFADDPHVLIPRIHWPVSSPRVLTMEDVSGIRIGDLEAMCAAGVDPAEVASTLYGIYMRQFFVTHLVHADPHPGNLFVHLVESTSEPDLGRSTDFRIAFVDFGMTTEIPERLRRSLREFAIGLGTRDARRVVDSYVTAGTLLPGADIERLVEAHEAVLRRFWGVPISALRDVALDEAQGLAIEFRDLLFQAPVQLQADMLFAMRAVGLLSGLATSLDPEFDPWAETIPFARRFALEERFGRWRDVLEDLGHVARHLLAVPAQIDRLMTRVESGEVDVRTTLSPESQRRLVRLERSTDRLAWMVAAGSLLVAGSILRTLAPDDALAPWLLAGAAGAAVLSLLARHRG